MSTRIRRCALALVLLSGTLLASCHRESASRPAKKPTRAAARKPATARPPGPKLVPDGIQFVDDYPQALAFALEQGKPLLLFFTADWCRYCHQMADEAFRQTPVVSLSERFVCVLVDADRERSLCNDLEVKVFPTILFVTGDGAPLGRLTGKQPSHKLVIEMQSALQTTARRAEWLPGTITR